MLNLNILLNHVSAKQAFSNTAKLNPIVVAMLALPTLHLVATVNPVTMVTVDKHSNQKAASEVMRMVEGYLQEEGHHIVNMEVI